jgi:hypothetical protein
LVFIIRGYTNSIIRYVNLTGDDIKTIERNTDMLLYVCKDIDLAVNLRKHGRQDAKRADHGG